MQTLLVVQRCSRVQGWCFDYFFWVVLRLFFFGWCFDYFFFFWWCFDYFFLGGASIFFWVVFQFFLGGASIFLGGASIFFLKFSDFFEIINFDKNFIENIYFLLFENFMYRFN